MDFEDEADQQVLADSELSHAQVASDEVDLADGSINCYAYNKDVFGELAMHLGSQFAEAAAFSVYNAQVIVAAREKAAQLEQALESRAVIDQAIGIIRARTGATPDEAFARLRQISQTENIKLHEIARRMVEGAARRAR